MSSLTSLTSLTSLIILSALSARAAPILQASDVPSYRLWSTFASHPASPSGFKPNLTNSPSTNPPAVALALAATSPTSVLASDSDNSPDAQMAAGITGSIVLIAFVCIAGYLVKEWRLRQKSNSDGYSGGLWTNSKEACGIVNEPYVDESPPANPPMTNQTSLSASLGRTVLQTSTERLTSELPVTASLGFQAPNIRVPKQSVVPLSGVVPSAGYTVDQTESWGPNQALDTGSP